MIFQAPGYTTHPPQHLFRHMSFSEGLLDEDNAIIGKKCYIVVHNEQSLYYC